MGFLCPVTAFDLGQSGKVLEHRRDVRNVPLCIAQLPVEVRSPLFSGLETPLWDLRDSNKESGCDLHMPKGPNVLHK